MHDALVHNSAQPHAFNASSNSNQSMPLGSGTMTDLLHSSLGDTRYSDTGSTGYHSGTSMRSVPGSNFFINDRNSTFQSQHEPSHQHPHLWSPFDQHTGNPYSHNMSDLALALTPAQVSFTLVSSLSSVTNTFSTRKCSSRPQKDILSLFKTQRLCAYSRRI
jgi:hypothetical protein